MLLLTGCGVFDAPRITPDRETVTITMTVTENMPENMNGRACVYGDNCFGWRHHEKYNSTYCKD